MTTVTGRFAEGRLYVIYAISPLRPGSRMPTFHEPRQFEWKLDNGLTSDDLALIIGEGRRQLDRQLTDLEHIRGRAVALMTLCLAELAALSAGASRIFTHGFPAVVWALSVGSVLLSLGGAVALASAQAAFGRIDTVGLAIKNPPIDRVAALSYARSVSQGEQTIATRVTVLRDAVLLAVIGAILYAVVWPFTSLASADNGPAPRPAATSGVTSCSTCTSPSPFTSTAPVGPATTPPSQAPASPPQ